MTIDQGGNASSNVSVRRKTKKEVLFHGIPASPGIAVGSVILAGDAGTKSLQDGKTAIIPESGTDEEIRKFNDALDKTRSDILEMQKRLQGTLEEREASIFDAHLLIVDDKMLGNEVTDVIKKKHLSAITAFTQVIDRYISAISSMPDPYLKERAADVKDVAGRIALNLGGTQGQSIGKLQKPSIIIAKDLTPSDTAMMDRTNVLGFAVETGSRTSHTAILARSMKIPAVVGMQHLFERLEDGDAIIIDGFLGMVIIHPEAETLELYQQKIKMKEQLYHELLMESRLRAETMDGFTVQLAANIEGAGDLDDLKRYGAEGVGLFRTEYLYIGADKLPDEEEQFLVYKKIAEEMQGQPVVIRTLDVGGDKLNAAVASLHEPNPFLGVRAIRYCMENKEMFLTQLRAILRAGLYGNVRIMFPMISSEEELDKALEVLEEAKKSLTDEHKDFNVGMKAGIMVEIPSAALSADALAKKVDFFSIGTNDLVQYTLAVDRTNEKVAYLYKPASSAVLHLIKMTVDAAERNNIFVSVCGELAGDPVYTPILVGLGVRELSMSPMSIGPVRRVIRRMKMHEAKEVAEAALASRYSRQAIEPSFELVSKIAPDITKMTTKGF